MSRTFATLTQGDKDTLRVMLLARPFTPRERAYFSLCWLPVDEELVDQINASMPPNHRFAPRFDSEENSYLNLDALSDAIDGGRLSAILPILEDIQWKFIEPGEWPQDEESPEPEAPELEEPAKEALLAMFDPWEPDIFVSTNRILTYEGELIRVITGHTTQADWTPNIAVALFSRTILDGEIREWRQPTGAHDAYPINHEVSHIGAIWKSLIAANTTTPEVGSQFWELVSGEPEEPEGPEILPWQPDESVGVGDLRSYNGTTYRAVQSHTTQSGWIPPVVPSLWEAI